MELIGGITPEPDAECLMKKVEDKLKEKLNL